MPQVQKVDLRNLGVQGQLGLFALLVLGVVTIIVCLPLAWEVLLTVLELAGWHTVRIQPAMLRITIWFGRAGNSIESVVVALVLMFITIPIFLHWYDFIWFFWVDASWLQLILWHLVPSIWLNSNMYFNLYHAVTKNASLPTSSQDPYAKKCTKCHKPKPEGTHHCSTCNKCVAHMDHHCPFTANCVGAGNYRHFFLFVFYAWLSTVYALWIAQEPYHHCVLTEPQDRSEHMTLLCEEFGPKVNAFWVAVGSCAALTMVFGLVFIVAFLDTTILTLMLSRSARRAAARPPTTCNIRPRALRGLILRLGAVRDWWRFLFPLTNFHDAVPLSLAH